MCIFYCANKISTLIITMDVYIIGCGGNSKIVVDICNLLDYNVIGMFDDSKCAGVIDTIDNIKKYKGINIINSIGDCVIRQNINDKLKDVDLNWINIQHPQSYCSPTVTIGKGNIFCYGSVINSNTHISNFNLINTYAVIEHDCIIGNYNHFAPKSTLCGNIHVGNVNLFGASCTVIPKKTIGDYNIIGAMTLIVNNFSNNNKIVGIPGKIYNNVSNY
jgi:acetyltransferase EpsM